MKDDSRIFEVYKTLIESQRHQQINFHQIVESYKQESDRSAAILTASFLEEILEKAIRDFLIEDQFVDTLFKGHSPLSTFSAKIDSAYALGLITKDMKRDLDTIRKIRNYFAHNWNVVSFDDSPVSDFCRNLKINANTFYEKTLDGKLVKNPKAKRNEDGLILGNDRDFFDFKTQYLNTISTLMSSIMLISQQNSLRRVSPSFDYLGENP